MINRILHKLCMKHSMPRYSDYFFENYVLLQFLGNIIQILVVTEDICDNNSFVYNENVLTLCQRCRHLTYWYLDWFPKNLS